MTVLYRRADLKNAALLTAVCSAHATVEPVIRLSAGELSFSQHVHATRIIDITVTDGASRIIQATTTHKAFTAKLSGDSRHVTVEFFPEVWGSHNGNPSVLITTTCPGEDRVLVPIYVGNSSMDDQLTESLSTGNGP